MCVVSSLQPSLQLRRHFPDVKFVKSAPAAGFAELNNAALQSLEHYFFSEKISQPNFLLLLNDDARVDLNFFGVLQKLEARVGVPADIYAPMIFDAKNHNEIDSFGVEYFRSGYAKNCRSNYVQTTLATAGCELIRWTLVQKVEKSYGFFFNQLYFYYLEDVDLALRVVMIGGKIKKTPELIAFHHGSMTSGGKRNSFSLFYTYRNILWVIICCWPTSVIIRNLPNILLVQLWMIIYSSATCGILTYPHLLAQTVLSLSNLLKARRRIQSAYTVKNFGQFLSPFSFRTYHDTTISAL